MEKLLEKWGVIVDTTAVAHHGVSQLSLIFTYKYLPPTLEKPPQKFPSLSFSLGFSLNSLSLSLSPPPSPSQKTFLKLKLQALFLHSSIIKSP